MQNIEELVIAVEDWVKGLKAIHARIARHFVRAEPRQHALTYLKGLLGPLERKNGWHIAEWGGDQTPDGIQRLLSKAKWDVNLVRDDLQCYVAEHLTDPRAVLIVDETGFPKQGDKSAGVQVQYCGLTGEVENCQVGVFVAYAAARGATFLDRELYLPQSWTQDRQRCREAGIPDSVQYAPKTELARQMIERLSASGIPFAWVAADALYGDSADLRTWLEDQGLPYVLGVHSDESVGISTSQGIRLLAVKDCTQLIDARQGWQRVSMGEGTKGARVFDWACLPVVHRGIDDQQHWMLIRRSVVDPTNLAFYLVYGPTGTTLQEMVWVVGKRWKIEEILEAGKGEVGFDHYEVRLWISWYRHVTLAMLAHAYLTVMRSQMLLSDSTDLLETGLDILPLTVAEVRHLLWQVAWPHAPPLWFILTWSLWRRRHQARASRSHVKHRHSLMANMPTRSIKQQEARSRERSKSRRKGKGGSRLLIQVQYTADEQYLLIGKTGAQPFLSSDVDSWQTSLESVSSFHFSGKNGRFTACKEKFQGKYYYWCAHRRYHNKLYKQYIGTMTKLSPQHLEQVAAALQTRIAQNSSQSGKEETLPTEPTLEGSHSEET
jgi:SRSO17 transposase